MPELDIDAIERVAGSCDDADLLRYTLALIAEVRKLRNQPDIMELIQSITPLGPDRVTWYRWIPVTERLPELNMPVMTFTQDWTSSDPGIGSMSFAIFDGAFRWSSCTIKPTHWMPLPAPPQVSK